MSEALTRTAEFFTVVAGISLIWKFLVASMPKLEIFPRRKGRDDLQVISVMKCKKPLVNGRLQSPDGTKFYPIDSKTGQVHVPAEFRHQKAGLFQRDPSDGSWQLLGEIEMDWEPGEVFRVDVESL